MRRLVSLLESSCDAWHDSAVLLGVVKPSVRDHVKDILSRATVFSSLENTFGTVTTSWGHGDHLIYSCSLNFPFQCPQGSKLYGTAKHFDGMLYVAEPVQEAAVHLKLKRKYCLCLWTRIQRKGLFSSN